MASRQNIDGRPRPSGVLPTVQAGPAAGLADPTPTPVGPVSQGPRRGPRGRGAGRGRAGREAAAARDVGISDPNPDVLEPPPVIQVPPSPPHGDSPLPGGSRSGGGAGYRARTSKVARETTEEQTRAGRRGRFGQNEVRRTAPTRISYGGSDYGKRYGSGPGDAPRWSTSMGGGGYGTTPEPLPPEPEPEPPPPVTPPYTPPTPLPPREEDRYDDPRYEQE